MALCEDVGLAGEAELAWGTGCSLGTGLVPLLCLSTRYGLLCLEVIGSVAAAGADCA